MADERNDQLIRGELATRGLVREAVLQSAAYMPMPPIERLAAGVSLPVERIIKLDQNENPYGPSLRVQEALSAYERYHLYPDPEGRAVREQIARYVGVPASRILLGNGADELIDLIYLLTLNPDDEVIV